MRSSPDNADAGSSSTVVVGAPTSSGAAVVGDASSSSSPHAASSGGVTTVAATPYMKVRRVMMNGRPLGLIVPPPLSALRHRKVARQGNRSLRIRRVKGERDTTGQRLTVAAVPHAEPEVLWDLTYRPCA